MKQAYSYVRWSSEKQTDGSSEARQTDAAVAYAKLHELKLADKTYLDAGVSSFRGKNAVEGAALHAFLSAVDSKQVSKDCYLLIENIDRLSRMAPLEALDLLRSIVDRGVTLVTLNDGRQITKKSLNEDMGHLIPVLFDFGRSHGESKRKSVMVKASYDRRRELGHKVTSVCPSWLKLEGPKPHKDATVDLREFKLVPAKAKIVREVFSLALGQHGAPTIARKLNALKVKTLGTAEQWSSSLVSALLKNQSVIGTYTPKKAGLPPEPGHYPAIIEPVEFDTVQRLIKSRDRTGGQRYGNVVNLFTGLFKCGDCGGKVRMIGTDKKNKYIRCLTAHNGGECAAPSMPYNAIEHAVLEWLLIAEEQDFSGQGYLEDPRIVLQAELDQKQKELDQMWAIAMAAQGQGPLASSAKRIAKVEGELEAITVKLKGAVIPAPVKNRLDSAVALLQEHGRLQGSKDTQALQDLRERMRSAIKQVITDIVLFTEIMNAKATAGGDGQWRWLGVYGDIVAESKETGDGLWGYTEDGGILIEYELASFGFHGSRKRA